jgi:glycosyltransferase involved in cell wall biosynthesis
MHPSTKISIVVPSLNKARFIEKTLDSIVKQNYPNLEVIIQDGGSTDGSLEIIKKYAREYPKIFRYESKKDKGQLNAINRGFEKATGQILTYINADDVYTKDAFLKVAEAYARNPEALWFAGKAEVIDENGKEIARLVTWYKNLLLTFNFYPLLLVTNYLMQPSVFITQEAYRRYGPFTGKKFVMEYDLWLKIGKENMPVVIHNALSKFRISGGSFTSERSKELLAEDSKIIKKYTSNALLLFLHNLHNLGRLLTLLFLR